MSIFDKRDPILDNGFGDIRGKHRDGVFEVHKYTHQFGKLDAKEFRRLIDYCLLNGIREVRFPEGSLTEVCTSEEIDFRGVIWSGGSLSVGGSTVVRNGLFRTMTYQEIYSTRWEECTWESPLHSQPGSMISFRMVCDMPQFDNCQVTVLAPHCVRLTHFNLDPQRVIDMLRDSPYFESQGISLETVHKTPQYYIDYEEASEGEMIMRGFVI